MAEAKNDTVKVAVRVRPLNKNEQNETASNIVSVSGNSININDPVMKTPKTFTFDYAFGDQISNKDIYLSIGSNIVKNAIAGYNCCILAYGQTGSGKTYTMLNYGGANVEDYGLIPKIASELLELQNTPTIEYQMEVSFVEIYAEKIFDLLSDNSEPLKLHINPKIGTYIENLTVLSVTNINQVMKLIKKGFDHRSTSSTAMNEQSSRSHAIFNISFKTIKRSSIYQTILSEKISKIKLVDLAGSERIKTSKVSGVNYQEAIAINKSLSMLSTVFNELVETGNTTKCRSSVLTSLLADSITGNSKTIIIANVSPASTQYDISLQSLLYVYRTKKIVVHAKVNEVTTEETKSLINSLKLEIESLKEQLTKATDHDEIERLKEELAEYEKLYKENSLSWSDRLKASQASITKLETELVRRTSVIAQKDDDIKLLNDEKVALKKERDMINEEIAVKYKALDALHDEIHQVQSEKTILMAEKIAINNEKLKLLSEKVELMNTIHDLANEKEQLSAAIHHLIDEKNHLQLENDELAKQFQKLKVDEERYKEKLKQLNAMFTKPK